MTPSHAFGLRLLSLTTLLAIFAAQPLLAQTEFAPQRYQIRLEDLPKPFSTDSASQPPQVIPPPAGAGLQVPPGFQVNLFAEGLSRPRWLMVSPAGEVFLTESYDNRILRLQDSDGDGVADQRGVFAEGLNQPLGMAIAPDAQHFYIANTNAVVRFPYAPGQTRLQGSPQVITTLPGEGYRQHWTRNLVFSPDGEKLYVTVGSESNVSPEPLPRASIQVMNPDGSDRQTFAYGLRNPLGLAFHPTSQELFTTVNERDGLGDDLVPDYLTSVQLGGFYGWPFSYLGSNPDPRLERQPQLEQQAIVPDVLFEAHSAALGLVFYTGSQFPASYQNHAFVAFRGSWNRSQGTGYKVVRVPFDAQGRPEGYYEDFVTGWLVDPVIPSVWGRPVGLAVASDGSLLITDEPAGKIWRISYPPPAS
ncbi:MAG: sorbosone dehydrogenase family protein [Cyanobacteriota bacterium]|nr:sorbosone dehydrogenase family protein [Cyanobacteriota bacterium]